VRGGWGDDTLLGGDGSQRLDGNTGNDSIAAGDGADVLIGGLGADTLDGGPGYDVLIYGGNQAVVANLATGIGNHAGDEDLLLDIEAVVGSSTADVLVGRDDAGNGIAQLFRGGAGHDTIDGGAGVDQAQYRFGHGLYQVHRVGDEISVAHTAGSAAGPDGDDGIDSLIRIERLLFADRYVAFGTRAEEVARVAFVLWSPAIAGSTSLFARGISFYDVGYDFRTLVETALHFHGDSDAGLAAKLVVHTPGTTKTEAQLLALMAAAGGGAAGRIAAVSEMANDPKTFEQVALAGFITNGVACDLNFIDTVLFAPLPGG
jgi:RTX calcium-binding nonapeptide repeat (4 copies)